MRIYWKYIGNYYWREKSGWSLAISAGQTNCPTNPCQLITKSMSSYRKHPKLFLQNCLGIFFNEFIKTLFKFYVLSTVRITPLGAYGISKMDVFLHKFQTAFDPPPIFGNYIVPCSSKIFQPQYLFTNIYSFSLEDGWDSYRWPAQYWCNDGHPRLALQPGNCDKY